MHACMRVWMCVCACECVCTRVYNIGLIVHRAQPVSPTYCSVCYVCQYLFSLVCCESLFNAICGTDIWAVSRSGKVDVVVYVQCNRTLKVVDRRTWPVCRNEPVGGGGGGLTGGTSLGGPHQGDLTGGTSPGGPYQGDLTGGISPRGPHWGDLTRRTLLGGTSLVGPH